MRRRRRVSAGHVIWAYDVHIRNWAREGMTPAQIRTKLREEHSLHVGTDAIRDVIEATR